MLDPTGQFVPALGQGWRLAGGVYRPWAPDAAGRWQSGEIEMTFGVEDGLAAAYGADGRRQLREGEVGPALEARRAEGYSRGRAEGEIEGKRAALRRLARLRFGVVASLEQRIDTAGEGELDALLERVLIASEAGGL